MKDLADDSPEENNARMAPSAPVDLHPQGRSAYWASQIPEIYSASDAVSCGLLSLAPQLRLWVYSRSLTSWTGAMPWAALRLRSR